MLRPVNAGGGALMTPIALTAADDLTASQWLDIGRDLHAQDRTIKWLMGDWLNIGIQRFTEQLELALPQLADDPKALAKIGRVSAAFSPDQRHADLTFDHHAHVASLPAEEAQAMLQRAAQGHISARQTRIDAMKRRQALGQVTIFSDEDFDYHELANIKRAWNRAQVHVRMEFLAFPEVEKFQEVDA